MFGLLVVITVILGIIAAVQLSKVYQLTAKMRNNREEDISLADNKMNAWLMLVFMVFFFITVIYFYAVYGNYYGENGSFLPVSASKHGVELDWLFNVNIIIITFVFFLVHILLFGFAWKYYYREDRKAYFFPHDNKLELIWTIIPTIVLAFIIIFGLRVWNSITDAVQTENPVQVEVYSKQFDWTVRYPGADKELGFSNYNLISSSNPLGIVSESLIKEKLAELDGDIAGIQKTLEEKGDYLPKDQVAEMEDKIYRLNRHKLRIVDVSVSKEAASGGFVKGSDDVVLKGELHLPIGREVEFIFNSRDVIHSAYLPHFRAQMNCVPGIPTRFKMTPTISSEEMRKKLNDPNFDYVLLCNKVCGASHNNMGIKIIIESEEDYAAWMEEQKTFDDTLNPEAEATGSEKEEAVETVAALTIK